MKFLIEIDDDELKDCILEDGDVEYESDISEYNYCAYVSSLIGVNHSNYEVEVLE